jgi:hypothetical protein
MVKQFVNMLISYVNVPVADASDENDVITEVRSPSSPRQLEVPLPPTVIPVRQPQQLPPASPSTSSRHEANVAEDKDAGSWVQLKDSIAAAVPPQVAEQVQDKGQAVQTVPRRSGRVRHAPKVLYNPV